MELMCAHAPSVLIHVHAARSAKQEVRRQLQAHKTAAMRLRMAEVALQASKQDAEALITAHMQKLQAHLRRK